MKKVFCVLLIIFSFICSFKIVKADTNTPSLNTTIDYCLAYVISDSNSGLNHYSSNLKVYVYDLPGYGSNSTYKFKFTAGDRLRAFASNDLTTECATTMTDRQAVFYSETTSLGILPEIGKEYSFTTDKRYLYIYLSTNADSNGSISWVSDSEPSTPVEPEPPTLYEPVNMIYVPNDDTFNKCYVVQNSDVIRAYDVIPNYDTSYNYRDYYINSSYIYKDGTGSWGSYSTLPVCLSSDIVTSDYWYRLDMYKILIMFFILSFFGIFIPIKLFSKILRKGVL